MDEQRPCDPLSLNNSIIQYFRVCDEDLTGIKMIFATYCRPVRRKVEIRLYEILAGLNDDMLSNETLASNHATLIASEQREEWADNEEFILEVEPGRTRRNSQYALQIDGGESVPGAEVTLWLHRGEHRIEGHISTWSGDARQGDFGLRGALMTAQPISDAIVPRAILYSPVTQCNLNCIHCISRESRSRKSIISPEIKENIRRWCQSGLVGKIATDYSGDILWAEKKFGGELDFLKSLNVPLHIDTNGVYLDRDAAEALVQSALESINISLDAATSKTFQRVRKGAPPLDNVIENIAGFMAVREKTGAHQIDVSLSFTLMRSTIAELPDFVKLAARLGVKTVHARHLEAYWEDMGPESLIFDQARSKRILKEAVTLGGDLGVAVATADLPETFGRKGHAKCHVAWGSAVIMGNGDVAVCCVPRTTIGNLHEKNMEEIWNGPHYQEFRRRVNSPSPPPQCDACPMMRDWHNVHSYLPFLTMRDWQHPKDWDLPNSPHQDMHHE